MTTDLTRLEGDLATLKGRKPGPLTGTVPDFDALERGDTGIDAQPSTTPGFPPLGLERREERDPDARFDPPIPEDIDAMDATDDGHADPDADLEDEGAEPETDEEYEAGLSPEEDPGSEESANISPDQGALAALKNQTDLSNCLMPLLRALHWDGDPRHVAEAVPHFIDSLDITSFRNILASLDFESRPVRLRLGEIDHRLYPCLFLPDQGDAMVLLEFGRADARIFDGGTLEERMVPRDGTMGAVYFFKPTEKEVLGRSQERQTWFGRTTERFRGVFYQTLLVSLAVNLFALATPLFVMSVYDRVIATGSLPMLGFFGIGVAIAVVADWVLRAIRARMLAMVGARLGSLVGNGIFHRIMYLPPSFTERATIGAQVSRLKDFETIRDFFTGPLALMLLELPFALVFVIAIAFLAGPVAVIPIIMVALYVLVGLTLGPLLQASVARASRDVSRRQELLLESLNNMRAIKYAGAEQTWYDRFRTVAASAAIANFRTAQLSSLVHSISHFLMIAAGVATVVYGVFRVLDGVMTIGALVASMILVWRVLAPLQTAFLSLARANQVRSSVAQVNNLMNLKPERSPTARVTPLTGFEGTVDFDRVSIRYAPDADPAMVGVSFHVEPNEVVAVIGGNGSGKSTLAKLLAAMYQPQAGSIRIDGTDIRQLDPVELRHSIAYVPQSREFFYGTIEQNLRLAHPTATKEEIEWACDLAGVLKDIENLSQGSGKWRRTGFEVRIGDLSSDQMPSSLMQRLHLARGYLKQSSILILDEPGNGLDFEGDQAFCEAVQTLRYDATIFIVTHRPSHIRLADKVIWMEKGAVQAIGTPDQIMSRLAQGSV